MNVPWLSTHGGKQNVPAIRSGAAHSGNVPAVAPNVPGPRMYVPAGFRLSRKLDEQTDSDRSTSSREDGGKSKRVMIRAAAIGGDEVTREWREEVAMQEEVASVLRGRVRVCGSAEAVRGRCGRVCVPNLKIKKGKLETDNGQARPSVSRRALRLCTSTLAAGAAHDDPVHPRQGRTYSVCQAMHPIEHRARLAEEMGRGREPSGRFSGMEARTSISQARAHLPLPTEYYAQRQSDTDAAQRSCQTSLQP
ncbi:hypothetical protein B0H14DRAFT_2612617 [Mycena olivaceomarginata]|nr:hypothetical protein B0H14DRAFT_2612617 [Mycena olivaceomarginata]